MQGRENGVEKKLQALKFSNHMRCRVSESEGEKGICGLSEGVGPNKSGTSNAKNMILQAPDEIDEEG